MEPRSLILLSCSREKRSDGERFDPDSRRICSERFLPREGSRLLDCRKRIWTLLKGGPPRLYNEDQKGGFRDDRKCNKDLVLGPDFGGTDPAKAIYLPAWKRYAGRFFSKLEEESPEFWSFVASKPVEILFVSGLYGLLLWDELIQDYDCHFADYTKGPKRNSVGGIWKDALRDSLYELVRSYRERDGEVVVYDLLSELRYQELIGWEKVAGAGAHIYHRMFKNFAGPNVLPKLAIVLSRELPRFWGEPEHFKCDQWYDVQVEDTTLEYGFEYPLKPNDNCDAAREGDTTETRKRLQEVHPELNNLPPEILNQIVLAEHSWRIVEPNRQFDFGVVIVAFAKAVEAYLRWVQPTWRDASGKVCENPTLGSIVHLMQGTRWSPLQESVRNLNEHRRGGAHSGKGYGSKDVQRAKECAFNILEKAEQIRSGNY